MDTLIKLIPLSFNLPFSCMKILPFSTSSNIFSKWPQLPTSLIHQYTPTPQKTPQHHHNEDIERLLKDELNNYPAYQARKLIQGWQDHRMMRDYKRRVVSNHYAPLRARLVALKKNYILPNEIKELASLQINSLPRDSNWTRINTRCVLTSRRRGCKTRWRISRIMWRHFADYNKMSGVVYCDYMYNTLQKRKHLIWPPPGGLPVANYVKNYHDNLADKTPLLINPKSFVKLT